MSVTVDETRQDFTDAEIATGKGKAKHSDAGHLSGYFTNEERQLIKIGRKAVNALRKSFDNWMDLGKAVQACYECSERVHTKGAFLELLKESGLHEALANTPASQVANAHKLRMVLAKEAAVREWRKTLMPLKQIRWSSPSAIYANCPVWKAQHAKPARIPLDTLQSQNKELNRQIAEMHNEPPSRTVEWLAEDGKLAEVVALGRVKLGDCDLPSVTGLMTFYNAWKQTWTPIQTALQTLSLEERFEALERLEDDIHQAKLIAAEEMEAAKGKVVNPAPLFGNTTERRRAIERIDPELAGRVVSGEVSLAAAEKELAERAG